jgi:hypothetical protein
MRRFSRIGQCGAAAQGALCALILTLILPLGARESRAAAQALLAPTPLILKDGRIASVAVHVLSFRQGAEALDAEGSAELRALTREAATASSPPRSSATSASPRSAPTTRWAHTASPARAPIRSRRR